MRQAPQAEETSLKNAETEKSNKKAKPHFNDHLEYLPIEMVAKGRVHIDLLVMCKAWYGIPPNKT